MSKKSQAMPAVVVHICNLSPSEAEAEGAWTLVQSGLSCKTLERQGICHHTHLILFKKFVKCVCLRVGDQGCWSHLPATQHGY